MIFPLPQILCEGGRIRLRRFLPQDAAPIFAFSQEESTRRELPDEVFDSLAETAELLDSLNQNAESGDFPIVYCIALKESDAPVGHVSLSRLSDDAVEIGYAIGEAFQGKCLGGEAARLFTHWALTDGGLSRLYGVAKESNPASFRCLEKAGYRLLKSETRDCFGGCDPIREYVIEKT